MKNGVIWQDVNGKDIQAHGGCILEHDGTYYWYGEHKGQPNCPGTRRVDIIGVSCYSSTDLVNWKYEGLALPAVKDDPASPLHPTKVLERPKVLYNEKTGKFVMWMHLAGVDYTLASVGIAVADNPVGPFTLLTVMRPNYNQTCGDITLFQDEDGVAYLIHVKDWIKTLNIARLNDSYTGFDGMEVAVLVEQEREAPAVCKHNGRYFMVTSGCTGWDPNSMLYAISRWPMGKWRLIDNPCEGPHYRETFFGQSTFIFEAGGKKWLMLDHWHPYDLQTSGYSILPIEFEGEKMTVRWVDEWNGI